MPRATGAPPRRPADAGTWGSAPMAPQERARRGDRFAAAGRLRPASRCGARPARKSQEHRVRDAEPGPTESGARALRSPSTGHGAGDAARVRPWSMTRPTRRRRQAPRGQATQRRATRGRASRGGPADAAGPWHPLDPAWAPTAAAGRAWARIPARRRPHRASAAATRTTWPRRRRRPSPCRPEGRPARPEGWSDPAFLDASGVAQAANGPGCLAWDRRARGGTRARGGFRLGIGGRFPRRPAGRPRSRIDKA